MQELIFILPVFIILFVILFQIFSIIKKVFSTVMKKFELTIEQADQDSKRNSNQSDLSYEQYDQEEVKQRITAAEKESLAKTKAEMLNKNSKSTEKPKKVGNVDDKNEKEFKGNSNSFAEAFAQYNEAEKLVIYNEILSKPKALRKN